MERMNEQIMALQNKVLKTDCIITSHPMQLEFFCAQLYLIRTRMQLLEALDWKLMHESGPSHVQVFAVIVIILLYHWLLCFAGLNIWTSVCRKVQVC